MLCSFGRKHDSKPAGSAPSSDSQMESVNAALAERQRVAAEQIALVQDDNSGLAGFDFEEFEVFEVFQDLEVYKQKALLW